jgi:hypothetical protein
LLLHTINQDGFQHPLPLLYHTQMLWELVFSIGHRPELRVQYTQCIKNPLGREPRPELSHELAGCHCNM